MMPEVVIESGMADGARVGGGVRMVSVILDIDRYHLSSLEMGTPGREK